MGQISQVIFAPHTPRIHAEPFAHEEPWVVMVDALSRLGPRVQQARLDAIVVVSVHWISTFPIYVKTSEQHRGCLTAPECPDLIRDVPYAFAGASQLAKLLVSAAPGAGLFVREAEAVSLVLDYGTVVPMQHLFRGATDAPPIVPTSTCLQADDDECFRWGGLIAEQVAQSEFNVGLLISGSFSHRLVREPAARPLAAHEALDHEMVELLCSGSVPDCVEALAKMKGHVEVEMGGRHLHTALGAMAAHGSWQGETFGYGPSSGSGNPVLLLSAAGSR